MSALNVNKFVTLNMMQSMTKKCPDMGDCWGVKVTCKMKSVIRSRAVAFIRKIDGVYLVTLTMTKHKTFMGALASLMPLYVESLQKLVMSMAYPVGERTADWELKVNAAVAEILGGKPEKVARPVKPTYDRGDKKEYLHPLRRAITKLFGGKYSR